MYVVEDAIGLVNVTTGDRVSIAALYPALLCRRIVTNSRRTKTKATAAQKDKRARE